MGGAALFMLRLLLADFYIVLGGVMQRPQVEGGSVFFVADDVAVLNNGGLIGGAVPHIGQFVIAEVAYLVGCQLGDVHVLAPISLKCSNQNNREIEVRKKVQLINFPTWAIAPMQLPMSKLSQNFWGRRDLP